MIIKECSKEREDKEEVSKEINQETTEIIEDNKITAEEKINKIEETEDKYKIEEKITENIDKVLIDKIR